jgi:hypothetical protein
MSDYTQSFYLEKDKNTGKEVLGLDFSYLIALILIASCGFLIALQISSLFNSVNNSLINVLKKHFKNIMSWSWVITLLVTICVIALSIGLLWLTFQILIKNNKRAKKHVIEHHPGEDSKST